MANIIFGQRKRGMGWVMLLCGLAGMLLTWVISPASAQGANCLGAAHWIPAYNGRLVNHTHIFCGEVNRQGRLVGLHSRAGGQNPPSVQSFSVTQGPNSQGIYTGEWSYVGRPGERKFSTMFPDRCNRGQVLNSIAHAEANRIPCPAGAPNWAWCGLNRPATGPDPRFCEANDNRPFAIAGASTNDGHINTGFPLRQ